VGVSVGLYPSYSKQFRIAGSINSRLQVNRLCSRYRTSVAAVTSNASIREKRVGDIGMLKMGVLACKLWGKWLVVRDVVVLRSCIGLGSYVDVGVYRERRGGRKR
jgi:hypothetical protein